MDWLQTLIVATVPALVTAGALILQQHWNRATELARIAEQGADRQQALDLAQGERDHARQMALDERAAAVEADRVTYERELRALWRDERRTAHEQLIEALEKFVSAVSSGVAEIQWTPTNELSPDGDVADMTSWESDRMDNAQRALLAALPRVQLVASDDSRAAAAEAARLANSLEMDVRYRRRRAYWEELQEGGLARGYVRRNEVQEAQRRYAAAARQDLGTNA